MEKRSIRPAWVLLIGALALFDAGCTGEEYPIASGSQPVFASSLVLRDSKGAVATEFAAGEPVTFELTVRNLTDGTQQIVLPDSQTHEFEIDEASGSAVWNWAHDRSFLAVITRVDFAPGESKLFTETWSQTDRDGRPVAPGAYDASGFVPVDVAGLRAEPVRLNILP